MVKKHANRYLRQLNAKNLSDFSIPDQSHKRLLSVYADGERAARDLVGQCTDDLSEKSAAEIEGAVDGISDFLSAIDNEIAIRKSNGNMELGSNHIDYSKRPQFEDRTSPAVDGGHTQPIEAEAYSIRSAESFTKWAKPRCDSVYDNLSDGALYRAILLGPKTELERRALSEGSDGAGGVTVPTIVASQMIDKLRSASVVIQAGAQTVPLQSDQQKIARLASDPSPAFRDENAAITESDPTFDSVTFLPRSLALMIKISRELYEDSLNLERELPRIMATALAKEVDKICLLGTGSAPQPRGVLNTTGVGATALGGGLTSFAPLLVAQTGIVTANAGATTPVIGHPREFGDLAALSDSTGQPLRKPDALDGIPMLSTTAIPVDGGGGSNESTLFLGNWSNLMIGIRSGVRVEVLKERFAENHQLGLVAHMRADVQLQHPAAFWKITGITS
jgi:HK97 family phage major capsid protein